MAGIYTSVKAFEGQFHNYHPNDINIRFLKQHFINNHQNNFYDYDICLYTQVSILITYLVIHLAIRKERRIEDVVQKAGQKKGFL